MTRATAATATLRVDLRRAPIAEAVNNLVYTPIAPCRLLDTRGFGAPISGGPFAPGERRAIVPAGACGLPATGVSAVMMALTTQNLTPQSGGYA